MRGTGVAVLLALMTIAPGGAHADPIVVGTDQSGDFREGSDPDLDKVIAELGAAAGMDLVGAAIERDGNIVNFIIHVTGLPEGGGTPEVARYTWNLRADGEEVDLSGKFTDYSRGACDPTNDTCPPPRDPGQAPFSVRGNCVVAGDDGTATVKTCEELALVHATFDPTSATITIPVPFEHLGCEIGPGEAATAEPENSIVAIPAAFFSSGGFPKDDMKVDTTVNVC